VPLHRKLWEWFFITEALAERDMLRPGRRGLGFGVGREPLVALFASMGCEVLATDQSSEEATIGGWTDGVQYAGNLAGLNDKALCDHEAFERLATFRTVDMRSIPPDLGNFDFTWSSCAFEHLGDLEEGLRFVKNQMRCLRPGGVAVHTTELNVSSDGETIRDGPTVLYRRRDLQDLSRSLRKQGDQIEIDFTLGETEDDLHVDRPPWSGSHLRIEIAGHIATSFALVIEKGSGVGSRRRRLADWAEVMRRSRRSSQPS
jgi:SAM-dependent methyltransferase